MKIPSNRQWTQDNSGDTLGILGDTTNMTFDTKGKARLARKAVSIYGNRDDADVGYPIAINYFADKYVVLTDVTPHSGNFPNYTFDSIATAPTLELWSDAVVFNSLYFVSTNTSIYTTNTTMVTWTDRAVSLTANVPHPLEVFNQKLAVGDANTVKLITTAYAVSDTLTLPTEYEVTTIREVNSYLYVGTKNLNGGNAKIFVWDGNGTDANYVCEVGSSWVFSMTPYLSTVAAITSQGQLGIVNGTTFQELAILPVYADPHARWQDGGGSPNGRVYNRGMCTIGDSIYLNIDGDVDSGFVPEMKSGIWVYDPAVGLYHRTSGTQDRVIRDSSLTVTGDVITTTATHYLKTGDSVVFDIIAGITGLVSDTLYYVTVLSATTFKVSRTRKAVQSQNYVTLGGTASSDTLVYCQNTEYGDVSASSGAVLPTVYAETPHDNLTSEIIWGSRFTLADGTAKYGIFSFCDSYNIGSFTTQRVYTDNITQNWKELYNFIDGISLDTEEVVVKVQTKYEPNPLKLDGVWLDANTINSANTTDYSAWLDMEVGDEIVIRDGYGRGRSVHIESIETSATVVSISVDENIGLLGQLCDVYTTSFKKVGQPISVDDKTKEKVRSVIDGVASPWTAIKIELRGFQPAVNMMELSNTIQSNSN